MNPEVRIYFHPWGEYGVNIHIACPCLTFDLHNPDKLYTSLIVIFLRNIIPE